MPERGGAEEHCNMFFAGVAAPRALYPSDVFDSRAFSKIFRVRRRYSPVVIGTRVSIMRTRGMGTDVTPGTAGTVTKVTGARAGCRAKASSTWLTEMSTTGSE